QDRNRRARPRQLLVRVMGAVQLSEAGRRREHRARRLRRGGCGADGEEDLRGLLPPQRLISRGGELGGTVSPPPGLSHASKRGVVPGGREARGAGEPARRVAAVVRQARVDESLGRGGTAAVAVAHPDHALFLVERREVARTDPRRVGAVVARAQLLTLTRLFL